MDFQRFFDDRFQHGLLGNSWERWIAAASIAAGILVLAYGLKGFLAARLRKSAALTETQWDDVALLAIDRTSFAFIFVLALHFGTQSLDLGAKLERARDSVFFLFLFFQFGVWLTSALRFFGDSSYRASLEKEPGRATTISTLVLFGNIVIWITMVLLLLSNYGVNISALVAGLGIGGIAVAFALQNILGDLFASFSIVLDKPFVIGDSINVNGSSGTVEHIGLKTTRVRSVDGEQLVFSNSELLKNVLKNFKRMERRRALFTFGLIYETPPAKLHRARDIVQQIINEQKSATFDRCHLATLAASSLDFEVVYWMETSDYNVYADTHHRIMTTMIESFAKEGLEFAYPHQVQVTKESHANA